MEHITRVEYFEDMDSVQGVCSCGWSSLVVADEDAPDVEREISEHTRSVDDADGDLFAELAMQGSYAY